jgi:hypothetical protein
MARSSWKALRHLAFELRAWLGKPVVVIAAPHFQPPLVPVGAIAVLLLWLFRPARMFRR